MQPLLQQLEGERRRMGQGGLFHEIPPAAQIHGIEKGRRGRLLLRRQMLGPIVHEHKLTGAHGRGRKGAHNAIGRLIGCCCSVWPLNENGAMAAGVDHDAGQQLCPPLCVVIRDPVGRCSIVAAVS